jgi:hypothetical protein
MQIRELRCRGFPCWPPEWVEEPGGTKGHYEEGILKDVNPILGTALLKIIVEHEGGSSRGLVLLEKKLLMPLYHKLKENVGKPINEIGNLEIKLAGDA